MNARRLWAIVGVLGSIAVLAIGWFAVASPQLSAAADAAAATAETEAQNAQLESELAALKDDYAEIGTLLSELADYAASVPAAADYRELLAALDAVQAQTGIRFSNVTFGDAVPYTAAVTAAPAATPEAPADGETTTETPDADVVPTSSAPATSGVAPVVPSDVALVSQDSFYLLPVSVTVYGGVGEAYTTVARLREMSRLFLVTQISASDTANGSGTSNIAGYVFVLLDPHADARLAAAVAAGEAAAAEEDAGTPTATPTPTPSDTPIPTPSGTPTP